MVTEPAAPRPDEPRAATLRAATWIRADDEVRPAGERPAVLLRGRFTGAPGRAVLTAAAHGVFEVFLNGIRVGDDELSPGFTAYRRRLQVPQWDVTDLIGPGENVVGVVLSDGWFRGRHGFQRRPDGFGTRTALLLAITTEVGQALAATDADWQWRESHITRADLMDGQSEDLRLFDPGWATAEAGRADAASDGTVAASAPWHPVVLADDPLCADRTRLVAPIAPPVRRVQTLAPVSVTHPRPGIAVIDFGQNVNGWVRLRALGGDGERTVIRHGEALDDAGLLTTDHLRAFDFASRSPLPAGQIDEVTSRGEPGDVFEPRHTTHGFRYAQVERDGLVLDAGDIEAVVVHTNLVRTGSFACSDERLEELHEAVEWSFRGNACEVPTDCPQRERSGFTGDWQVFADTAAAMYDVSAFSRKWLRDLAADQWDDGRVPTVIPNPAGAQPSGDAFEDMSAGSAGWGDAAVFVPWSMWRAYGDRAALAEAYPAARAWVEYARSRAAELRHPQREARRPDPAPHEQYLWDAGFHFGEWLEPGVPPNPDPAADHGIVATAYLARSAELLGRIAAVLDRSADAAEYARLSADAKNAWATEYLPDPAAWSQGDHVRALVFGLVPASARQEVADRLAARIRENDTRLGTGFLATGMLLPALADHDHLDLAYELLLSERDPSWLGMLRRGATTMWEWWDGVDDAGVRGSLNHYSKGAVAAFLHTHVAGIGLPDDPGEADAGYRRARIAPRPGGGLTSAAASIETGHGRLTVSWRLADGAFALDVEVPDGIAADVTLPDGTTDVVTDGHHSFTCLA
ncbi:alpha-L-rhamnosidase [Microbacterium invictum]|uniref:alpha-L-rhamnosidase n=1 Tax=Microbacterium invictum TaxID=515415 RepID=A0AA40VNI6_9MICO|nr:alpha-L-rhamnosidase [Microbacterium invictum]MBB4141406.1 alpha-L-rhamnosidase [Microbacterium invictum]